MVKIPEYEVLNFCFDSDNGCSLTVLANQRRCHVTVNPKQFQDRSRKGKEVQRTYRQLLQAAKAADQDGEEEADTTSEDEDGDDTDDAEETDAERDSAIDVSTPEAEEEEKEDKPTESREPTKALQDWIVTPLSHRIPSKNSNSQQTVQDWYHNPVHFYNLASTPAGKIEANEDISPLKLTKARLEEWLIPTISLPKKTLNLSVPQFSASELTVLSCATDPAPYHPILVSHKEKTYFLKPVDTSQPGPTIREIHILHSIAKKGLHLMEGFRCPELVGLVHFSNSSSSSSKSVELKHICALLLTPIPNPTPLTLLLDPEIPEEKRNQWAQDAERMVEILHENDLVWGDAKGDNFLVDGDEEKVWMIDFGGSYTEGWVDRDVKETEDGDWQGTGKVLEALEHSERDGEVVKEGKDEGAGDQEAEDQEAEKRAQEDADEEARLEAKLQAGEEEEAITASEAETDIDDSPSKSSSRKRSHPTSTETEHEAPPAKQKKRSRTQYTTSDTTEETTYCFCNNVSSGRVLACDGKDCKREWFHFKCLGIEEAPAEDEEWFCEECR